MELHYNVHLHVCINTLSKQRRGPFHVTLLDMESDSHDMAGHGSENKFLLTQRVVKISVRNSMRIGSLKAIPFDRTQPENCTQVSYVSSLTDVGSA